jgi:transposase
MGRNRKTYSETLKNEVALEALKESRTVNEIAAEYQISPSMVTKWKK